MFWRVSRLNQQYKTFQFREQTMQEKQAQSDHHNEQDLHTKAFHQNVDQVQLRIQINRVRQNQKEFG